MKRFFKGVRKHIDKLDAEKLREQYRLVSDEFAHFETIFNALKEGVIVLDENGKVVHENPAARRLLGMAPDDILPTVAVPLGKTSRREIALTYPDARTLELQTVPMNGETLLLVRDLTAEKARTEEELRAGATSAVRDLAAGVAHEIGNPLNALALNLQLLLRERGDDETVRECLHQVERLDSIVRGFLTALRPSKPNLLPGSLVDPLAACLKAFQRRFEERCVRVTLDAPAALPPAALDRNQLEQVFFNLVKNALEAMSDGGTLAVAVGFDDNDVYAAIRDSGSGMTTEQLARLFEPYRTTKAQGTGLGLMVSQRIVRDHGGSIDAESSPGRGTTFTVRLPRLERRVRELK
jgi:signal transduction histidine kinase